MAPGPRLILIGALCAIGAAAAQDSPCVSVKFDEGGSLPIAKSAIVQYQAVLAWPGPERIHAVDIVRPKSADLPPQCSIEALRLAPVGQGPVPDCTTLSNGKRACTYRIGSSFFAAKVVMQTTCDVEAVRQVVLTHVERNALASCRQLERSNNALLSDAYASPLRAQRGAAKRGR
jgi:hypothetical protein